MTEYLIHRDEELRHYGVKGTHWGVRRYQNEDGSYKPGAEGRYYQPVKISGTKKNVSITGGGTSVKHSAVNETYLEHFGILGMHWGIRRYQNPDGSYTAEGKRRKSKGKTYSDDYWNSHDKKDPKYMSDKELQKRINRLNNEKQYKNLQKSDTRKALESAGKQFVNTAIVTAIAGLAANEVKKRIPELISNGKDYYENLKRLARI